MSGGQQRLLLLAASLGGTTPIILGDQIAGLDADIMHLVGVAIMHAAGLTEPYTDVVYDEGQARIITVPPLAQWPSVDEGEQR